MQGANEPAKTLDDRGEPTGKNLYFDARKANSVQKLEPNQV